jgi:hypothetical protein
MARPLCVNIQDLTPSFYPVRNNAPLLCPVHHAVQGSAEGLGFIIIPAGFNAPLEFLTGFTTRWSSHVALERNNDAGT